MESDEIQDRLTIPEYYAGKNVFLTGGTGFIGKVFIEKVLRCCPNIGGIYCLVRPKKGQDASQRVKAFRDDKVNMVAIALRLKYIFLFYLTAHFYI